MSIIEARSLSYKYQKGAHILNKINFYLGAGQSLALVGANGAGKSTLLKLLVGVLKPDSGEILYKGQVVDKKNAAGLRSAVGLVFQHPDNQLFCHTVYEDVIFGPLNMEIPAEEASKRAELALNSLGITHLAERAPYRLSHGEKRLAAIASVISMEPEVILMDEPSSGLDPRARRNLIELLSDMSTAKVIATHDLDLAVKTCEQTIVLYNGKVAAAGESAKILGDDDLLCELGL